MTVALLTLLGCPPAPEDTDSATSVPECDPSGGHICTYAGTGDAGFNGDTTADGAPMDRRDAWFYWPMDIEFSPYGRPVIQDWNNHKIRMINDDQSITTIMGTMFVGDGPPDQSDQTEPGAPGTTVNLNHPTDCLYMPDGILLCASWHTHKIRTWDPATGYVLVWAGAGSGYAGDATDGAEATLMNQPKAIEYDESDGTVYIVDMRNERIRYFDTNKYVNTLGGDGTQAYTGDGGPVSDATFNFPTGTNPVPGGALALDGMGGLYVADTLNHAIRKIDLAAGTIATVAGTGVAGFSGDGGAATSAQLNNPADIEYVDGMLWIADTLNNRVRVLDTATGTIETVAGNGDTAYSGDDGPALDASLNQPYGIDLDADGTLYIADTFNHVIREVAP